MGVQLGWWWWWERLITQHNRTQYIALYTEGIFVGVVNNSFETRETLWKSGRHKVQSERKVLRIRRKGLCTPAPSIQHFRPTAVRCILRLRHHALSFITADESGAATPFPRNGGKLSPFRKCLQILKSNLNNIENLGRARVATSKEKAGSIYLV